MEYDFQKTTNRGTKNSGGRRLSAKTSIYWRAKDDWRGASAAKVNSVFITGNLSNEAQKNSAVFETWGVSIKKFF